MHFLFKGNHLIIQAGIVPEDTLSIYNAKYDFHRHLYALNSLGKWGNGRGYAFSASA